MHNKFGHLAAFRKVHMKKCRHCLAGIAGIAIIKREYEYEYEYEYENNVN